MLAKMECQRCGVGGTSMLSKMEHYGSVVQQNMTNNEEKDQKLWNVSFS